MDSSDFQNLHEIFISKGIAELTSRLDNLEMTGERRLDALEGVRKAFDSGNCSNTSLDMMYEIYEVCITYALSIADGNESLIQYANATSYNQSANLASCWFDDRRPRSLKHFEAGVTSAKRCLDLRAKLNKPPLALAMGHFILGVHEYSLKNYSAAEQAWVSKLKYELLHLEDPIKAESDLNVILSHGLIGLVRLSIGSCGSNDYEESLRRLERQRAGDNGGEIDLFKSELVLLKQQDTITS